MKPCLLFWYSLLPCSVWHGISDVSLTWQLISLLVQGIVWFDDSLTDRDIFQDEEIWVPVVACLSWNIVSLSSVILYYTLLATCHSNNHLYQYSFLATLPPLTAHFEYIIRLTLQLTIIVIFISIFVSSGIYTLLILYHLEILYKLSTKVSNSIW